MHIYVQICSFHIYLFRHSVCGMLCLLLAHSQMSERGVNTRAHTCSQDCVGTTGMGALRSALGVGRVNSSLGREGEVSEDRREPKRNEKAPSLARSA